MVARENSKLRMMPATFLTHRATTFFFVFLTAGLAAMAISIVYLYSSPVPHCDDWSLLDILPIYYKGELAWEHLWASFWGHRIVVPRLLLLLFDRLSDLHFPYLQAFGILSCVGVFAIFMGMIAVSSARIGCEVRWWIAPFVGLLAFCFSLFAV